MADISTGMKVTGLSQYKSAMQQAQQSVKTLDAQLKKTEAQYKATGDKEQYMSDKSDTLKKKLNEQQKAAAQAQKALDAMRAQGVDPASKSFQQMEQQLLKAQTGVLQTTSEINNLTVSEQEAAKGADQLTTSVNGISKKISLDQVISGVNSITTGLENAAKKAIQLGQELWSAIMDSARWADDTATQAMMYDMTTDEYQRMAKVAATWGETSVEAIMSARQRIRRNIALMSKDTAEALKALGVDPMMQGGVGKFGNEGQMKDWEDMFWEIGDALMNMGDQYNRAEIAQSLFGRKYEELVPMWKMGREAYEQALKDQTVVSEDTITDLATMNDTITQLTQNFETLKTETIGALAPALTAAAEALSGLLTNMMDYLQTEEGQKMLSDMEASVSALFDDLGKIDPKSVVKNFTNVFNAVIESFKWLVDNKDTIVHALEGVVIGWAGLKLTGGALQIYKLITGLQGLSGGLMSSLFGGGGGAGAGAGATGTTGQGLIPRIIASGSAKVMDFVNSIGGPMNGAVLWDWFMNQTYTGQVTRNTGSIVEGVKQGFEQAKKDLESNARSFADDWRKLFATAFTDPDKQASNSSILGEPGQLLREWEALIGAEEPVEIPTEPTVGEDAAEDIAKQVGIVTLPAHLRIMGGGIGLGGGGENLSMAGSNKMLYTHANGLPFVPWDGYIAMLHRGERVLTASANRSYTANSNLYVENMNMNNGMDAQALAAAMNAQNQRIRSGFGS